MRAHGDKRGSCGTCVWWEVLPASPSVPGGAFAARCVVGGSGEGRGNVEMCVREGREPEVGNLRDRGQPEREARSRSGEVRWERGVLLGRSGTMAVLARRGGKMGDREKKRARQGVLVERAQVDGCRTQRLSRCSGVAGSGCHGRGVMPDGQP